MDKVLDFLISVENDYKSEYLTMEQEIARLNEQITHIENMCEDIKNSIDESYVIMSSSQAANEVENTELATLDNLLSEHKNSLTYYKTRLTQIDLKLDEVRDVIELYKNETGRSKKTEQLNIADKIKLVSKLIRVDPNRAIEELKIVQDALE